MVFWKVGENEIFWSNETPFLSIEACFLLCRPWLYSTQTWNADVFCCETFSGLSLSSDLRGCGHFGTRECLLPAPSLPLLRSPPYNFSVLHPLERGKEQMKSWLHFLILSVNPNVGSAIMIFPYAAESNCLELVLSQAMEVIPAFIGTVPNLYSSILREN